MADRPSLGVDPVTGDLFCIFVGNPPGDTSAGGFPNGEIYAASSCDGGLTWGPAINLTETPSPGCTPGDCEDDDQPSQTEIVDDYLRIQYINDKDAGEAPNGEGDWTLNPVLYLKVQVDSVPCTQVGIEEEKFYQLPKKIVLSQNTPNPFGLETTITYSLTTKSNVTLTVYNIAGREVVRLLEGEMEPGYHSLRWDGKDEVGKEVSSGIYFYRLHTYNFIQTRKMVLLR
jgi:hypothetical protein